MEVKDLDFENTSEQGFPYCPYCGSKLMWENDFMASEIGYLSGEVPLEQDKCVHLLRCSGEDCGLTFEVESDSEEHLLCVIKDAETDDDEPEYNYTKYAIEHYGKQL